MMDLLRLFAATLLIAANLGPGTQCPLENSSDLVLLPHQSDCNKYFLCYDGSVFALECPNKLHFSPYSNTCEWPWKAGCESLNSLNTVENDLFTEVDVDEDCPLESENDVLLPHETDCGKFYKCAFGQKVVQDCPAGLYFNNTSKACDWADQAGCKSVLVLKAIQPFIDDIDAEECPFGSAGGDLLPHETNCTKFYECANGKKVELECPEGLHFNNKTKRCDWPNEAGCKPLVIQQWRVDLPVDYIKEEECPLESEHDVLLPHETDCEKFYKCAHGKRVEQNCPAGLHFNNGSKRCDWPNEAGCKSVIMQQWRVDPLVDYIKDEECPLESEHDVLLPHETDCEKFYKCAHGKKVEQNCPVGLHFNNGSKRCDWPNEAGGKSVIMQQWRVDPLVDYIKDEECPLESEHDVLLPHETDCEKFYKCAHGKRVEQNCPAGLHFNNGSKRCDWPNEAGCKPIVPVSSLLQNNVTPDVI